MIDFLKRHTGLIGFICFITLILLMIMMFIGRIKPKENDELPFYNEGGYGYSSWAEDENPAASEENPIDIEIEENVHSWYQVKSTLSETKENMVFTFNYEGDDFIMSGLKLYDPTLRNIYEPDVIDNSRGEVVFYIDRALEGDWYLIMDTKETTPDIYYTKWYTRDDYENNRIEDIPKDRDREGDGYRLNEL